MSLTDVTNFIERCEPTQKHLLQVLHRFLMSQPGMTAKLSYKIPFYYRKSWVCYLNPLKDGSIELAFTRGNELSNAQKLLESKGRKQVMSLPLTSVQAIPFNEINEILQEALLLDETQKYASKRSKK